jgi:hypothetical protein
MGETGSVSKAAEVGAESCRLASVRDRRLAERKGSPGPGEAGVNPTTEEGAIAFAIKYLNNGWWVVPIPARQKRPNLKDWLNLRIDREQLTRYFRLDSNIGLQLGKVSGGLVDVDLDSSEAVSLAATFLPTTGMIHGRPGNRRSHYWYRSTAAPRPIKLSDQSGRIVVEIRSDGQQTIVPPSVHPSGETLFWESESEPATVDVDILRGCVSRLAAAALLARHWPSMGQRHEASLALAGMLWRLGFSQDSAVEFIEAVARTAGDEEAALRSRDAVSTADRASLGRDFTGAKTLGRIIGAEIVGRVAEWLKLSVSEHTVWPDPEPLNIDLPNVPPFDLELLPSCLRALVHDVSERMQTPPDYAAAAAIVSLAGCTGRRALIHPKVEDGWEVIPNLWGAIIAPPGMMKSPVLRAVTLPLYRIEEKWRAEFESENSNFEVEQEQAELRWQAWREQYKSSVKKGEPAPVQPDRTLRSPQQKRLVLSDATVEKLHEILAENPGGVVVLRDELTGWLAELDRPGRETERAFYLQAWNGDAGFTMDRIGRGSIYVPAVCVSLMGNIQPSRIRWYLAQTVEGGPCDDGLFQRFQFMVWPDQPDFAQWRLVDRAPNSSAIVQAEVVYDRLATISSQEPVRLRFCADAQSLFFAWLTELERRIRGSTLPSPMISHLAKYRSLMPSLAGLFRLAEFASSVGIPAGDLAISLEQAQQAAAICDYLEAHARRVYACIASPERHATAELGRHIQAGELPLIFTTREIYRRCWTGLDGPERVRKAVAHLEDAGWLRRVGPPAQRGSGRPSESWQVNPKVLRHAK